MMSTFRQLSDFEVQNTPNCDGVSSSKAMCYDTKGSRLNWGFTYVASPLLENEFRFDAVELEMHSAIQAFTFDDGGQQANSVVLCVRARLAGAIQHYNGGTKWP
jgi:hypothetical protein